MSLSTKLVLYKHFGVLAYMNYGYWKFKLDITTTGTCYHSNHVTSIKVTTSRDRTLVRRNRDLAYCSLSTSGLHTCPFRITRLFRLDRQNVGCYCASGYPVWYSHIYRLECRRGRCTFVERNMSDEIQLYFVDISCRIVRCGYINTVMMSTEWN